MKKIVSLMLAFVMSLTLCIPAFADELSGKEYNFREELQELIDDNIEPVSPANVEGFESFNQSDYDSNFKNYADMDATLVLPMIVSEEEVKISNVVGTVFCQETNEPIANAIVTVETAIDEKTVASVTTDDKGRFQILGLAGGFYNWIVENDEYYTAKYIAYDICDGITTMFTFYMSNKETISRESFRSGDMALIEGNENLSIEESENIEQAKSALEESTEANHSTFSFSKIPTLSSFTVGMGASSSGKGGTAQVVNRTRYLVSVVTCESLGAWICEYTYGMSREQITQYYAAQAIAACSFIEWAVHGDAKHPGYTVCDQSDCQRYDPTRADQRAVEALATISDTFEGDTYYMIMLYRPTSRTYDYIYPAYFRHCNGATRSNSVRPELKSVSCTDIDGTHSAISGNGWGMCQMGAANMAKNGYKYYEILQHYYYNTSVFAAFQ